MNIYPENKMLRKTFKLKWGEVMRHNIRVGTGNKTNKNHHLINCSIKATYKCLYFSHYHQLSYILCAVGLHKSKGTRIMGKVVFICSSLKLLNRFMKSGIEGLHWQLSSEIHQGLLIIHIPTIYEAQIELYRNYKKWRITKNKKFW
jgi:hypothetical protein